MLSPPNDFSSSSVSVTTAVTIASATIAQRIKTVFNLTSWPVFQSYFQRQNHDNNLASGHPADQHPTQRSKSPWRPRHPGSTKKSATNIGSNATLRENSKKSLKIWPKILIFESWRAKRTKKFEFSRQNSTLMNFEVLRQKSRLKSYFWRKNTKLTFEVCERSELGLTSLNFRAKNEPLKWYINSHIWIFAPKINIEVKSFFKAYDTKNEETKEMGRWR